jgi:hypothetical protein
MSGTGSTSEVTHRTPSSGSPRLARHRTSDDPATIALSTGEENDQQPNELTMTTDRERHPWNSGKLIRQKPPLQPKHVWAMRTRLRLSKRPRDLALFNIAIDSKLRGCDVVSLKDARCRAARIRIRSSHHPREEDGSAHSL